MESLGQQPSIEEIVQEMAQPVLCYLKRYVGDHGIAEDLTQETLVRMARGFSSFKGHSSIKTWAFAIANRVAADYYRHPDRRIHILELEDAPEQIDTDCELDERVMGDEMNDCVREVIDSLPADYRSALVLRDLEEFSLAQIAEVCCCSLATVKIRVHRARLRLKAALENQCEFYRGMDGVFRCDRKA